MLTEGVERVCDGGTGVVNWGVITSLIETCTINAVEYARLNMLLDQGFPKLALNHWKSCVVADLSEEVIAILTEQFQACPSTMSKLIVECPHGAALRRAPDATAFPHRERGFSVMILSQWTDPADTDENIAWARTTFDQLRPFAQTGGYINYLDGDDSGRDKTICCA